MKYNFKRRVSNSAIYQAKGQNCQKRGRTLNFEIQTFSLIAALSRGDLVFSMYSYDFLAASVREKKKLLFS